MTIKLNERLIITPGQYGNVIFMSGGAASGKSYAIKNYLESNKYKIRDVDEWKSAYIKLARLKNRYPEIQNLNLKVPEDVAMLHEFVKEKGIKGKTLDLLLRDSRPDRLPNLIFDITGAKSDDITDVLPLLIEAGYKKERISLIWVLTDYQIAIERNKKRSRTVPDDIVLKTHKGAATNFLRIVKGDIKIPNLDGSIYLVLGDAEHSIVYDGHDTLVKDFTYFKLKNPGKEIESFDKFKDDLKDWVVRKTPLDDIE